MKTTLKTLGCTLAALGALYLKALESYHGPTRSLLWGVAFGILLLSSGVAIALVARRLT
jgi:hypothetical protein